MKVATIYGQNVFVTGIRRYAEEVEKGLQRAGAEVTRVELARREWKPFGKPVGGFLSFWLARARRAPRGYDIVHALDPAVALPGSDVVTLYDLVFEEFPEWYQRDLASRLDIKVSRFLARRVPTMISISEVTKRVVVERWGIEPERIVVIPLAPDHAKFHRVERASEHLAKDRPNLVFLGVNNPRKNIVFAVRTAAALEKATGQRPRLLRLGPDQFPSVRAEYVEEAKRLGVDLVEPGFLSDEELASILTHADAFLWPPVAEGFGIPLLEAMACGLPVVALDLPINREVAGPLAVYHGPDVDEAAAVVARVLSDRPPAEPLMAHARSFTWERNVAETLQVYERVLAARR